MSTCISREGEYSDHEPGDWCPRCGAFNEEAIVAERDRLRAGVEAALVYLDSAFERIRTDEDPDDRVSAWVLRDPLFDALCEVLEPTVSEEDQ